MDNFDSGSYELDGLSITPDDEDRMAEIRNHKIGFIFQTFNLIAKTTALKNVELPMLYQGIGRKERRERALELLRMVKMEDLSLIHI